MVIERFRPAPDRRAGQGAARQQLSASEGAKGHDFHHRAIVDLAEDAPGHRQLLIRRTRSTGELA